MIQKRSISAFSVRKQQTFKCCFNVVFLLIQSRDMKQRETNVESTLRISMLIWTTLDNVETTLWKWPFPKMTKKIILNSIHWIESFNYYFIILFILFRILGRICWRILAMSQKFLKIMKNTTALQEFNLTLLHFVNINWFLTLKEG